MQWQSRRLKDTCETLINMQKCRTHREIRDYLLDYLRDSGVNHLLAGVIPPPQSSRCKQLSHVLLDAWPEEWSQRYFSRGYLYRDPAIQLVKSSVRPFRWCEIPSLGSVSSASQTIMDEAAEFGLCEGLTFSFSTLERCTVGFSLAGRRLDLDPVEERSLQLVTAFAFGCALGLRQPQEGSAVVLSRRQTDVIQWAADGLTVDETADRLGISFHTTDTYLRIARRKLGVTSSIHAVAEAFRRGIIR